MVSFRTPVVTLSTQRSSSRERLSETSDVSPEPLIQPPQESWGTRQRLETHFSQLEQDNLDEMLDRATKRNNAPRFIARFHPQSSWLWFQWKGTVLQHTWKPALTMALISLALVLYMEPVRKLGAHKWALLEVPHEDDLGIRPMRGFTTMWGYLLTMCTFVNSFFLSQAYGFWLATKGNVRKVQGRLNDIGMLIATHAQRDEQSGRYTPASRALLDDVARNVRLFHMLFWAGQVRPARGDKGVSYSALRTERGLKGLLSRHALTQQEHDLLVDNPALTETQRHAAVLEWIVTRFVHAKRANLLHGGVGLESRFLEESCKLRAVCASISDDASARMPLSYVHLVQLLVDCLVALAPFALYPKLGVLTVLLSPILVVFYRGFLQLSKSFLDPFGNEDSVSENFSLSCLLCETNAGSTRWFSAIEGLPFPTNGEPETSPRPMATMTPMANAAPGG